MCGTWRSSRDRGPINPESRLGVAVPFILAAMRPRRRGCSTGRGRPCPGSPIERLRQGRGSPVRSREGKVLVAPFHYPGDRQGDDRGQGIIDGWTACRGVRTGGDHDHYRRHLRTGAREAGEAAAFPSIGLPPGCRSGNGARDGGSVQPAARDPGALYKPGAAPCRLTGGRLRRVRQRRRRTERGDHRAKGSYS